LHRLGKIGSNGDYHSAPRGGGFVVALLAAFAASWLSVWLNDLLLWVRRKRGQGRPPAASLPCLLLLVGCQTTEERLAAEQCQTYGVEGLQLKAR
jgi:hypothetical protein